jgi:hypothetical protein
MYKYNQYGIYEPDTDDLRNLRMDIHNRLKLELKNEYLVKYYEYVEIGKKFEEQLEKLLNEDDNDNIKKFIKDNRKQIKTITKNYKKAQQYISSSKNIRTIADELCTLYIEDRLFDKLHILSNTGYNYVDCNKKITKIKKELINTLKASIPNENKFKYVMVLLASCLTGHNTEEIFNMWLGEGRNGKGLIDILLRKTLGDYYGTITI